MRSLDWVVLVFFLLWIVGYGLYKGRTRSNTIRGYLLADKTMPWWAMGLSIMATQASAITFIGSIRFSSRSFLVPITLVSKEPIMAFLYHHYMGVAGTQQDGCLLTDNTATLLAVCGRSSRAVRLGKKERHS